MPDTRVLAQRRGKSGGLRPLGHTGFRIQAHRTRDRLAFISREHFICSHSQSLNRRRPDRTPRVLRMEASSRKTMPSRLAKRALLASGTHECGWKPVLAKSELARLRISQGNVAATRTLLANRWSESTPFMAKVSAMVRFTKRERSNTGKNLHSHQA